MDWRDQPTSEMATKDLVKVMAETFKHLPDSAIVSLGDWEETPGEPIPRHFHARLALKAGDLRQIAKDIAAE